MTFGARRVTPCAFRWVFVEERSALEVSHAASHWATLPQRVAQLQQWSRPEQRSRWHVGEQLPAPRLQNRFESRAGRQECHRDRKSTRLNSSHGYISYAVFCL